MDAPWQATGSCSTNCLPDSARWGNSLFLIRSQRLQPLMMSRLFHLAGTDQSNETAVRLVEIVSAKRRHWLYQPRCLGKSKRQRAFWPAPTSSNRCIKADRVQTSIKPA